MARSVWWDNVEFDAFCGHFYGMTREQIADDITESIGKLLLRDDSGDSFGAIMVRNAKARQGSPKAEASRQNGLKGGRPKKPAEATEESSGPEQPKAQPRTPEKSPAAPAVQAQRPRRPATPAPAPAAAPKTATKKPGQEVWGTFANVYLSQDEYNEILHLVGNLNSTREMVDSLSAKLEDGSTTSANHFATLTYWANWRKKADEEKEKGKETFTEREGRRQVEQLKKYGLL